MTASEVGTEQGTARLQGLDLRPVLFQILHRGTLQKKDFKIP